VDAARVTGGTSQSIYRGFHPEVKMRGVQVPPAEMHGNLPLRAPLPCRQDDPIYHCEESAGYEQH